MRTLNLDAVIAHTAALSTDRQVIAKKIFAEVAAKDGDTYSLSTTDLDVYGKAPHTSEERFVAQQLRARITMLRDVPDAVAVTSSAWERMSESERRAVQADLQNKGTDAQVEFAGRILIPELATIARKNLPAAQKAKIIEAAASALAAMSPTALGIALYRPNESTLKKALEQMPAPIRNDLYEKIAELYRKDPIAHIPDALYDLATDAQRAVMMSATSDPHKRISWLLYLDAPIVQLPSPLETDYFVPSKEHKLDRASLRAVWALLQPDVREQLLADSNEYAGRWRNDDARIVDHFETVAHAAPDAR